MVDVPFSLLFHETTRVEPCIGVAVRLISYRSMLFNSRVPSPASSWSLTR